MVTLCAKTPDRAYFAAKIAHCFHALDQGLQTQKHALRALDMDPRYIRGKPSTPPCSPSGMPSKANSTGPVITDARQST